jgi:hypothetical protein
MSTLSKHLFAALAGTALLASCSRPVAYFQPSARENFKTVQTEAVVATAPVEAVQPVAVTTEAAAPVATPTEQVAQTKQAVDQLEAYVRNDSKLASNKKLTKRLAKVNEMLTTASTKATASTNLAPAKKSTLMERMMLKKLDKKIKNHVAPEKTNAMNSNVRLGLIIGLVGLLLWLLGAGSVLSLIGVIGFVIGIVLIIIGVVNT